jgi:hypothetical protein
MVEKFLEAYIAIPIAIIAVFVISAGIGFGIALAYWLRDRISGVSVSRTGMQIHTNDVPVWSKIVDKIDRIDASMSKSIRKITTRLMILDPDKHGTSADVMLVVWKANLPLIYATYENHHTREMFSDGGNAYLADKVHDVLDSVWIWGKRFPEITEKVAREHVCCWMKEALLPNMRRESIEKIVYYNRQINRSDVSKTLREILVECRDKNQRYVQCIDEFVIRPDIQESSSIIYSPRMSQESEMPK